REHGLRDLVLAARRDARQLLLVGLGEKSLGEGGKRLAGRCLVRGCLHCCGGSFLFRRCFARRHEVWVLVECGRMATVCGSFAYRVAIGRPTSNEKRMSPHKARFCKKML